MNETQRPRRLVALEQRAPLRPVDAMLPLGWWLVGAFCFFSWSFFTRLGWELAGMVRG